MLLQSNSYLGEPKKRVAGGTQKKFFKSDPRAQNFRGRPGTKKNTPHHDNNTHTYTRMGIREIFLKKPAKQKMWPARCDQNTPPIMLIVMWWCIKGVWVCSKKLFVRKFAGKE